MTAQSVAALVALVAVPLTAFALGADHPLTNIDPKSHPHWPAGTADLVNSAPRVGGHWVNSWDGFYYAGDAAALNRFLLAYAKLSDTPLAVVLHAGRAPVTGPLGKPHTVKYDWSLHAYSVGWGGPGEPARPKDARGWSTCRSTSSSASACRSTSWTSRRTSRSRARTTSKNSSASAPRPPSD